MNAINPKVVRENLIGYLRFNRSQYDAMIDGYVAECEHQEGIEYWMQFTKPNELLEDFDLYVETLDATDGRR